MYIAQKWDPLIFAIVFSVLVGTLITFAIVNGIKEANYEEDQMKLKRKLEDILIEWEVGSTPTKEICRVKHDGKGLVVGYGHDVTKADKLGFGDKITVMQAATYLQMDMNAAIDGMSQILKPHQLYPMEVQLVISAMCFQLGRNGTMEFKRMLAAIKDHNYDKAAQEMLDSRWAKQTPRRAKKMASLMRLAVPSSAGG